MTTLGVILEKYIIRENKIVTDMIYIQRITLNELLSELYLYGYKRNEADKESECSLCLSKYLLLSNC